CRWAVARQPPPILCRSLKVHGPFWGQSWGQIRDQVESQSLSRPGRPRDPATSFQSRSTQLSSRRPAMNLKIARFLGEQRPATPCLGLDLDVAAETFGLLRAALPAAKIYYALKANPAPEILALLVRLGSCFDVASVPEIEMVLAAGATPDRISYGN